MFSKIITGSLLAASVALIPAESVEADAGDFIAGAIIGGIVGANANKQRQRQRTTSRRTYSAPKKTYHSRIPATQEGRNIQASLNYFGFNAGTVDGQLGQKTRNAVSQYQAYLGYPVTGHLSSYEQNLLTSSYNRAQAGGYAVQQQIAATPDGTRGLLKTYRAEMAGHSAPGVMAMAPQPLPLGTTTTTTTTIAGASALAAPVAPEPAPQAAPEPEIESAGLPNFLGSGAQASLASHCNTVSLITNTNGGFTTLASMGDPNVALNEQFCLARTYAIAESEDLISKVGGFTPSQISTQCDGFGPAMKDHVAALSLKSREAVVSDVSSFILGTGMSPAQLSGTAKICMGVGYRTDNMDVALGSALLLYAMGEGVYGELMGHHLSQGFGTARRVDMASDWYQAGLAAADNGAAAVFVPGQPERTELIRAASMRINGVTVDSTGLPKVQPASSTGLPSFAISE